MRNLKKLMVVGSLAMASSALAQQALQRGVSFALPAGGGATVGYTHWLDAVTSVRADVGVDFTKNDGTDATFAFSIDAGLRKYIGGTGAIKAFTEPGAFLAKTSGAGDLVDKLTLAGTFAIGAEYYVGNNFSFGGKAGAALTLSGGFKNISIKTGTSALFANYYW